MRQIVLDTETTGLSPSQGHRVIEIGCVELINRRLTGRTYHTYLQPDREVEPGAMRVHGITNEFLKGKPRFKDVFAEFKMFIENAELIIHNAPFDVGFLASEFARVKDDWQDFDDYFTVIDTLVLARQKYQGQKNNLDALCKRLGVDNQHRDKHGALLDAEILAKVYLAMTGGQETLSLEDPLMQSAVSIQESTLELTPVETITVPFIAASETEKTAHEQFLDFIEKKIGKPPIFRES